MQCKTKLTDSDNDEYYLHDDEFMCQNDLPVDAASAISGPQTVGLMGRMINVSLGEGLG